VLEQFRAKAKELDLLPETKFVDDNGRPLYTSVQIATKLGMSVEDVEKDIRENLGEKLEARPVGRIHQVH